jgi:hypothetical protein
MTDPINMNRRNWDERASIHARDATGFYALVRFRAGGLTLHVRNAGRLFIPSQFPSPQPSLFHLPDGTLSPVIQPLEECRQGGWMGVAAARTERNEELVGHMFA